MPPSRTEPLHRAFLRVLGSKKPSPATVVEALELYAAFSGHGLDLRRWGGRLEPVGGSTTPYAVRAALPGPAIRPLPGLRGSDAPAWLHTLPRTTPPDSPMCGLDARETSPGQWSITFTLDRQEVTHTLQMEPRPPLPPLGAAEVHIAAFPSPLPRAWSGPVMVRAAATSSTTYSLLVTVGRGIPSDTGHTSSVWTTLEEEPRDLMVYNVLVVRQQSGTLTPFAQATLLMEPPIRGQRSWNHSGVLSLDVGTATSVTLHDTPRCGAFGNPSAHGPWGSGWGLVAGEPTTAWRVGCGAAVRRTQGLLPSALCLPEGTLLDQWSPRSFTNGAGDVLHGRLRWEQLWLPQEAPEPNADALHPTATRFKTFRLLHLGADAAHAADLPDAQKTALSCDLMAGWLRWLGLHLAWSATQHPQHRTSFSAEDLNTLAVVATWPDQPIFHDDVPGYRELIGYGVQEHLIPSLKAAWGAVEFKPDDDRYLVNEVQVLVRGAWHQRRQTPGPAELLVVAHFGGMSLDVDVMCVDWGHLVFRTGHSYLLGAEVMFDVAGIRHLPANDPPSARHGHRDRWQGALFHGVAADKPVAATLRTLIDEAVLPLIVRQTVITPRCLAHQPNRFSECPVRVQLAGEGWLTLVADLEPADKEAALSKRVEAALIAALSGRSVTVGPRLRKADQARYAMDVHLRQAPERLAQEAEVVELCRTHDLTDPNTSTGPWRAGRPAALAGQARRKLRAEDVWFDEYSGQPASNGVAWLPGISHWGTCPTRQALSSLTVQSSYTSLDVTPGSTFVSTWVNECLPTFLVRR